MYYLLLTIFVLNSCNKNYFGLQNKEKRLIFEVRENKKIFKTDLIQNIKKDELIKFISSLKKEENSKVLNRIKKNFSLHYSIYTDEKIDKIKKDCEGLVEVVKKFSPSTVEEILNGYDKKGLAPIHLAIILNKDDILKYFLTLEENIDINRTTSNENLTPLSLAVSLGIKFENKNENILKILIDKGAKIETLDIDEISILGHAALNNDLQLIEYIIEDKKYELGKEKGKDPLTLAVLNNNYEVVNYLFSKAINEKWSGTQKLEFVSNLFANVNAEEFKNKLSPENQKKVVSYISEYKNVNNKDGKTPIMYSIEYDNEKNVKELIEDIDIESYEKKFEVLFEFCKKDDYDTVKKLVDNGADVDKENSNKETCLNISLKYKANRVAELLIGKTEKLDHVNKNGLTYFHIVIEKGNFDLFEKLLKRLKESNLNVEDILNKKTEQKNTALHIASRKGYTNIVKLLLENGGNVNAENEKMKTPLHNAVKNECKEIIKELLQHGADSNRQDDNGNTPLHYAVLNKDFDTISILLEKGASPLLQNKEKNFPRDLTNDYNILVTLDSKNNYLPLRKGSTRIEESEDAKERKNSSDERMQNPTALKEENSNIQKIKDIMNIILNEQFSSSDSVEIEKIKDNFIEVSKGVKNLQEDRNNVEEVKDKIKKFIENLKKFNNEENLIASGISREKTIEDLQIMYNQFNNLIQE